ncbi:MAG TPA: hypothetical protein VN745_04230 [Verrucomicrobiae bacterium]|nr:hypothetical protein [Verrucomicrobiae bacterium]
MLSLSRPPSPRELLRYSVLFCLIAWGISVIVLASHPGLMTTWYQSTRQFASDMLFALIAFAFLYAQYACVERYLQSQLEASLGYVQVFACLAAVVWVLLAYFTVLITGSSQAAPAYLSASAIFYMLVFGEAVFIGNIFWSYGQQSQPKPVPTATRPAQTSTQPASIPPGSPAVAASHASARLTTARPGPVPPPQSAAVLASPASARLSATIFSSTSQIKRDDSPKASGLRFDSPVAVFGSGAAFFVVMGMIFAFVSPLVTRMPVLWNGRIIFVAAGYLWMPLAAPFAVFAAAYWLLARDRRQQFTPSTTRIHFVCTALMALECARVYFSWASTVANSSSYRTHIGVGSFSGAFALLLVAIATLVWNVYSSIPRSRPTASLPAIRRVK